MQRAALGFLAGVLILHACPELPARGWCWGLAGIVPAIVYAPSLRLPSWVLAGFLWALLWAAPPPHTQLPAALEGVDLQVQGRVASLPQTLYRRIRFEFAIDELRYAGQTLATDGRLLLSWYEGAPALRAGERWRLTVRLKRPRGLANPGGGDYERRLYSRGIVARGYVRAQPRPVLLEHTAYYPVAQFRQVLAERIEQVLAGNRFAGILTALAVGERGGITSEQWDLLIRTGTAHLIAISGLHIGLIAVFGFTLARLGWAWLPGLAERWPAPKAAALFALLCAAGYALLAGLALPTQRALIMLSVALAALLGQRPPVPSRALALALLLVLLRDPAAPLGGGFWLSFGAVAAILYALTGHAATEHPLSQWLRLQVAINLALLPAQLLLFQQIPLLAGPANLIAIPWVSITVVPLTLLAVLAGFVSETLQVQLLTLAALALHWLWAFLSWLGQASWALVYRPAPPLWTLLFVLPGLALLLAPRGLPGRWLGALLCLPLFCFPLAAPAPGAVWFTLLDVGEGLAAVIRTQRHVLVYDTGPWLGSLEVGQAVLLPFLRQQGADRVDTLIISHADSQHSRGVRSLRAGMPIDRILTPSLLQVPVEGARRCHAGIEWHWDGVHFQLLHPSPTGGFSGDDASCVLRVEGAAGRVLLPGDIEPPAERALLRAHPGELAAEILIAPHQGRRNLSLPAFLEAVEPRYILFATGHNNRFGYPRPETVRRYAATGATLLDTGQHGAITFRLEPGAPLQPELYRVQQRRYWHTP